MRPLFKAAIGIGLWESFWWLRRNAARRSSYADAIALARKLNKPLVLVGAPDSGATPGPGCGDVTVDIAKSSCPNAIRADITKPLPFSDDSAVVLVHYVLEYVNDYDAAMAELRRVAGKNLFVIAVQPWTLTAFLYPGAKRTVRAVSPTR